jgi:AraC-like DNA-binding protein
LKIYFPKSDFLKKAFLLLPIFVAGVFILFKLKSEELSLIPYHKQAQLISFSDRTESGKSEIHIIRKSKSVKFDYTLHPGNAYPFAGIVFSDSSGYFDLSGFNSLEIKLKASEGKKIGLYIGVYVEGFTDTSRIITFRYLEKFIDAKKITEVYKIPLSEFKTPTWWYQVNKISENNLPPVDFSKVHFINIQNCLLIGTGVKDQVEIEQMFFYKDHSSLFLYFLEFAGFYYLIYTIIWLALKRSRKKELVIKYEQVETLDLAYTGQEKIISFISANYSDSELVLDKIQKETGVSELKISSIIKKISGLSFKQYLNKLRLEEAKRLLRETELQISEIAYKVGYGNISHFNRVFKEATGQSPNDFRKKAHN